MGHIIEDTGIDAVNIRLREVHSQELSGRGLVEGVLYSGDGRICGNTKDGSVGELVDPEAALLTFVVEVKGVDGARVECILTGGDLLGSVDMAQGHKVEAGSIQRFGEKYRLELREELGLSALGVTTGDGIVGHEDGRERGVAFGTEGEDDLAQLLGEYHVLFLFGKPGELGAEYAAVEARQACNVHPSVGNLVALHPEHRRFRDDMHAVIAVEMSLEHRELLTAVMVWGAAHDHHRANVREGGQCADSYLDFVQATICPHASLMEQVTGNEYHLRLLEKGDVVQMLDAHAGIISSQIAAILFGAGEIADMPVGGVEDLHSASPSSSLTSNMPSC